MTHAPHCPRSPSSWTHVPPRPPSHTETFTCVCGADDIAQLRTAVDKLTVDRDFLRAEVARLKVASVEGVRAIIWRWRAGAFRKDGVRWNPMVAEADRAGTLAAINILRHPEGYYRETVELALREIVLEIVEFLEGRHP